MPIVVEVAPAGRVQSRESLQIPWVLDPGLLHHLTTKLDDAHRLDGLCQNLPRWGDRDRRTSDRRAGLRAWAIHRNEVRTAHHRVGAEDEPPSFVRLRRGSPRREYRVCPLRREELKNKKLAIFLSSGVAVEEPETSKRKFLEPLVEKYGLHPVMCDAFPGKLPSDGDELRDTMVPEVARQWAETLALKLAS